MNATDGRYTFMHQSCKRTFFVILELKVSKRGLPSKRFRKSKELIDVLPARKIGPQPPSSLIRFFV